MPAEVMMTTIPVTVLRSDSLTDLNNGAAGGGDSSCSGSGGEGDDPESGFSRGEQERSSTKLLSKSDSSPSSIDLKVCGVCGDKALGNNFNAVTCESCKAFFRRNALRSKVFVCPFSNNCKVDAVTRRFCQKCRLKKCFDIGMKKEWIMTDEEKRIKKQKIEQNRLKRSGLENVTITSSTNHTKDVIGVGSGGTRQDNNNLGQDSNDRHDDVLDEEDEHELSALSPPAAKLQIVEVEAHHHHQTPRVRTSASSPSARCNGERQERGIEILAQAAAEASSFNGNLQYDNHANKKASTAVADITFEHSMKAQKQQPIVSLHQNQNDTSKTYSRKGKARGRSVRLETKSNPSAPAMIHSQSDENRLSHQQQHRFQNQHQFWSMDGDADDSSSNSNSSFPSLNPVAVSAPTINNNQSPAFLSKYPPNKRQLARNKYFGGGGLPMQQQQDSSSSLSPELQSSNTNPNQMPLLSSLISQGYPESSPDPLSSPPDSNSNFNCDDYVGNNGITSASKTLISTSPRDGGSLRSVPTTTTEANVRTGTNGGVGMTHLHSQTISVIQQNQNQRHNGYCHEPICQHNQNQDQYQHHQFGGSSTPPPLALSRYSNSEPNHHDTEEERDGLTSPETCDYDYEGTRNEAAQNGGSHYHVGNHNSNNVTAPSAQRPTSLSTIDSILSIAIAAEFNAFGVLGTNLHSRELNKAEHAKLNELFVASEALHAPVDAERPINVSESSDPSLLNVINLTEIAIRRLIKMSKKISGFKNMCQEDQIALLKGGSTEMMILRSAVTYDPDRDSWQIPHSSNPGGQYNINLGVLKEARGNLYEEHQRFVKSFRPEWRNDENIVNILCAITLFTPERLNVIHKDVVKLEQDSYYYLLKRYLESIFNGCEAKSTYLQLIRKVAELRALNSSHVRVFLEMNPKEVEPLLIEIFDLK